MFSGGKKNSFELKPCRLFQLEVNWFSCSEGTGAPKWLYNGKVGRSLTSAVHTDTYKGSKKVFERLFRKQVLFF